MSAPGRRTSAIEVSDIIQMQPVYWRCSKPECNPSIPDDRPGNPGALGWLKSIHFDSPAFKLYDGSGLRWIYFQEECRATLLYSAEHQIWEEVRPASFQNFVDVGQAIPYQTTHAHITRCSSEPCGCLPDHTSILYNHNLEPIQLLGGLNLTPGRLEAHGWSCCAHFATQPPMSWDTNNEPGAGCTDTDHPGCHENRTGPCSQCFLVNQWAEPLILLNRDFYVNHPPYSNTQPSNQPRVNLPRHNSGLYYPPGPLNLHLNHLEGLWRTGLIDRVRYQVGRLLKHPQRVDFEEKWTRDNWELTVTDLAAQAHMCAVAWRDK